MRDNIDTKSHKKSPKIPPVGNWVFWLVFGLFFAKMARISVGPRDHIQKKFIGYSYAEPMGFIEEF